VQVDAYAHPEALRPAQQPAHLHGNSDSDRVGEDDLLRAGGDTALGEAKNRGSIDLALERAAEGNRDGDADRPLARDSSELVDRLIHGAVRVALVERLGGGQREVHLVEIGRGKTLVALLIQDEP
jgi:hypothetical protein